MSKTPKALTEVWEWKEKIFEERKDLSLSEWVKATKMQSRQLLDKRSIIVSHNGRQPKKAVGA
jgi:hypothetical protein